MKDRREVNLLRAAVVFALLGVSYASQANTADDESPAYCNSTGGGSHEWIAGVQLGNVNNTSAQEQYGDFTAQTADIAAGLNSITLTPGFRSSAYDEHWAVYIDYNQDADFSDDGELVATANAKSALTTSFQVPSSAAGITTRMRVAMRYGNPVADACRDISAGEVEDYTVAISSGDTTLPGMADVCQTEAPFQDDDLVDGDVVCLTGERQLFKIAASDDHTSIAISTSHGEGNLTLFANNGSRAKTDFSHPYSKHVGNNECIVLDNPDQYWSYLEVTGAHAGASLVADFNSSTCRVTTGEEEELYPNYGNDGYPNGASVNIKVFRAEFSDTPFDWESNAMIAEFDKMVDFYTRASYGKFNVSYEISHPIINLGKPQSYYEQQGSNVWHAHWQAKVLAETGIDAKNPGDKTIVLVTAPKPNNYNSTATVPYISLFHKDGGVIAHELGHALGLRHAYGLEGGSEVIGPGEDIDEESINYGGIFSLMGKGSRELMDFDLLHKEYFGWLDADDVPLVTTSGTYRLYAFDHGDSQGHNAPGNIGLKLQSGHTEKNYTYWLEYRTTNDKYGNNINNGVLVYLQGFLEQEQNSHYWKHTSHLLDMTPGIEPDTGRNPWWGDDFVNGELAMGKSYTDKWGAFTIKVVGKGGTLGTANAWIDVTVTMH
ncbi:GEVED domain-containing protein [Thalassomonas haliotis]|uniref:Collagenase n=1 Tax=Thalassomonas haliotis TaxID=485448 RepID=A0ABY7VKW9_9GAMM|nr:GEVED domain-containing protein [Thalassomonas haliotis]WDE13568.1 collagenase [Thalassomonas haliotis]